MRIHLYTYTHMHMYTHIHTYICIHIHTHTHIQTHTHSCPSGFTSSTVTCIAEPLTLSAGDSKSPNLNQRISFSFLYDTHFYFISKAQKESHAGGCFLLRNLLPVLVLRDKSPSVPSDSTKPPRARWEAKSAATSVTLDPSAWTDVFASSLRWGVIPSSTIHAVLSGRGNPLLSPGLQLFLSGCMHASTWHSDSFH